MNERRLALAALLAVAVLAAACGVEDPAPRPLDVTEVLGDGVAEGFARADGPRPFRFPRDHGAHPDFRTEWWYFVGNLTSAEGVELGYQLTFFRSALVPDAPTGASSWRGRDVYMAHLAVSDPTRGVFHSFERFARAAAGMAGSAEDELSVWLEDWSARMVDDASETIELRAGADELALTLTLEPTKGPVLQGDAGYSRKGADPGNASYYYSYPRLATTGTVRLDGREHAVTGTSWLDREWSTSALETGQVGWDWFALQLRDGRELMLYVMRRSDGSADPYSSGTLVGSDGEPRPLAAEEFRIVPTDTWTSPVGGSYPSGWRVSVPAERLELTVRPTMREQEVVHTFRYWEGAVRVTDGSGQPAGVGFVELTGYVR